MLLIIFLSILGTSLLEIWMDPKLSSKNDLILLSRKLDHNLLILKFFFCSCDLLVFCLILSVISDLLEGS